MDCATSTFRWAPTPVDNISFAAMVTSGVPWDKYAPDADMAEWRWSDADGDGSSTAGVQ